MTRAEVLTALTGPRQVEVATSAVAVGKIEPTHDSPQLGEDSVAAATTKEPRTANLNELLAGGREANEFMYPAEVKLPDGTQFTTNKWQGAAFEIAQWIGRNGKRPGLPFRGLATGYRYFINSEPNHSDRPMDYPGRIEWGDGHAFVHCNRSALDYVKCLHELCVQAGIPPDGIRLHMRPWGKAARKP